MAAHQRLQEAEEGSASVLFRCGKEKGADPIALSSTKRSGSSRTDVFPPHSCLSVQKRKNKKELKLTYQIKTEKENVEDERARRGGNGRRKKFRIWKGFVHCQQKYMKKKKAFEF